MRQDLSHWVLIFASPLNKVTIMKSIKKSTGSQIEIEKSISAILSEISFLEKYIYRGLSNCKYEMFDDCLYFRVDNSRLILDRFESFGIGVLTILAYAPEFEEYYFHSIDVDYFKSCVSSEYVGMSPFDPAWYRAAFKYLAEYAQVFSIVPFYPKGLIKYYAYESND
jgi:hypothetical protein